MTRCKRCDEHKLHDQPCPSCGFTERASIFMRGNRLTAISGEYQGKELIVTGGCGIYTEVELKSEGVCGILLETELLRRL